MIPLPVCQALATAAQWLGLGLLYALGLLCVVRAVTEPEP